jgi:hypothetical protein
MQNTFALTESAPGDFEPVQPFLWTGAWAILKTRKNLEQVQNCSCTDASFVLGDLKWCIQGLNQCKFPKNRWLFFVPNWWVSTSSFLDKFSN